MTDRRWTIDELTAELSKDSNLVERAIVGLYLNQSTAEKKSQWANGKNGIGFSAFSARMGCYYARWVKKGRHLDGDHLDKARQIVLLHMPQVLDLANHGVLDKKPKVTRRRQVATPSL